MLLLLPVNQFACFATCSDLCRENVITASCDFFSAFVNVPTLLYLLEACKDSCLFVEGINSL